MKFDTKRDIKRLLGVLAGATLLALNLKTFVSAGGLFPGGATGLTVLLQRVALRYFNLALPYSVLNIIIRSISEVMGCKFTLSVTKPVNKIIIKDKIVNFFPTYRKPI